MCILIQYLLYKLNILLNQLQCLIFLNTQIHGWINLLNRSKKLLININYEILQKQIDNVLCSLRTDIQMKLFITLFYIRGTGVFVYQMNSIVFLLIFLTRIIKVEYFTKN